MTEPIECHKNVEHSHRTRGWEIRKRASVEIMTELSMKKCGFTIKLKDFKIMNHGPSKKNPNSCHFYNQCICLIILAWTLVKALSHKMGILLAFDISPKLICFICVYPFRPIAFSPAEKSISSKAPISQRFCFFLSIAACQTDKSGQATASEYERVSLEIKRVKGVRWGKVDSMESHEIRWNIWKNMVSKDITLNQRQGWRCN